MRSAEKLMKIAENLVYELERKNWEREWVKVSKIDEPFFDLFCLHIKFDTEFNLLNGKHSIKVHIIIIYIMHKAYQI